MTFFKPTAWQIKILARQKLDAANQTRRNSALRGWRGQFAHEFVERDLLKAVDWVKHLTS
jgi:hypothetical protein